MAHGTRQFPSSSASDCSRSLMSPNNWCGFPRAPTTIWTVTARPKRFDISSASRQADGSSRLAHNAFPGLKDVVISARTARRRDRHGLVHVVVFAVFVFMVVVP